MLMVPAPTSVILMRPVMLLPSSPSSRSRTTSLVPTDSRKPRSKTSPSMSPCPIISIASAPRLVTSVRYDAATPLLQDPLEAALLFSRPMVKAALTRPLLVSPLFPQHQPSAQVHRLTLAVGVTTAQTLQGISNQILQNQQDLPVAIAANQAAGAAGGNEGASAISGALPPSVSIRLWL